MRHVIIFKLHFQPRHRPQGGRFFQGCTVLIEQIRRQTILFQRLLFFIIQQANICFLLISIAQQILIICRGRHFLSFFDGLQSLFILAAGCLHLGKLNQGFAVRILPVNIIFHQRRRLSQGFFRLLIIVQTQLQFAQTGINKGFPFRIACFVIQIGGIEIFLPRFVILAAVPTIIAGLKHFGGFGYKFAVISPRHNSKNSFAIISILLYIWAKDEKNKK